MMSIQNQLKAPMETVQFALTGGANASPELIKNLVDTFNLDHFLVSCYTEYWRKCIDTKFELCADL